MVIQVIVVEASSEEVEELRKEKADMADELKARGEAAAEGDQRMVVADIVVLSEEEIEPALSHLATIGLDTGELGP